MWWYPYPIWIPGLLVIAYIFLPSIQLDLFYISKQLFLDLSRPLVREAWKRSSGREAESDFRPRHLDNRHYFRHRALIGATSWSPHQVIHTLGQAFLICWVIMYAEKFEGLSVFASLNNAAAFLILETTLLLQFSTCSKVFSAPPDSKWDLGLLMYACCTGVAGLLLFFAHTMMTSACEYLWAKTSEFHLFHLTSSIFSSCIDLAIL